MAGTVTSHSDAVYLQSLSDLKVLDPDSAFPIARMYTQASSELGFRVTPDSLKKAAGSLTGQLLQEPTDTETQEEFMELYDLMGIPKGERDIPQTKGPGVSLTETQLQELKDDVEKLKLQLAQPQGFTRQQIINASAELADLAKKKAEFESQNKIAESMQAPSSVSWIGLSSRLSDHSEISPTVTFQELIKSGNYDWRNFSRKNFDRGEGNKINPTLVDFRGAKIPGLDLSCKVLGGKDFSGADMRDVNLTMSTFPHAKFLGTNLKGANFSNTTLRYADFTGAELPEIGVNAQPADLKGANFTRANLAGADLTDMDLRGIVLSKTNLHGASLNRANLKGAIIDEASLIGTSLEGENIEEMTTPNMEQIEEYLRIVRSEAFQKAYESVGVEQIRSFGSRAQGIGFEDPSVSPHEMASDFDLLITKENSEQQNTQNTNNWNQSELLGLVANRELIALIPEERKIAMDVSDEKGFSMEVQGDGSFLIYRHAPDNDKLPNLKAVGTACSLFVEEALPEGLTSEVFPDNKNSNVDLNVLTPGTQSPETRKANVVRVTSQHGRTEASRDSDYAMPPLNVLADQILANPHNLRKLEVYDPLKNLEAPDPDFTDAHLVGANLVGQNLAAANFTNADLRRANLAGANLQTAIMERAALNGANLTNADLSGAELIQVDLSETHLDNTNLTKAELKGANFYKQDLSNCNLGEAKLDGTFVAGAIITSDQLDGLRIVNTQFMGGLNVLEDESSYTELTAGKEELSPEDLPSEFQAVVDLFQGTEPSASPNAVIQDEVQASQGQMQSDGLEETEETIDEMLNWILQETAESDSNLQALNEIIQNSDARPQRRMLTSETEGLGIPLVIPAFEDVRELAYEKDDFYSGDDEMRANALS